jgi:soluble lytic murein transglycosylase
VPGAYEKLATFSKKNAGNPWGARAALALGYDDYNKNRAQQALAWFTKAKGDTLLADYVLYWTAQAQRLLKRNGEAFANLQVVDRDYPNTAMREQLLDALSPAAIETGHAQVAIDALNSYPSTSTKSTLLLQRAQAYKAAQQLARAAKDYQTLFYKFPLSDEGKAAGIPLQQLMHALKKEYPYPGVELQEQRAQAFFDAHQWKEARSEFEKLLGMLQDPENPHRQLAELRIAQARVQLKGSPKLVSSLVLKGQDVDAERLYVLSQMYRSDKKEPEMLSAIEGLLQNYPTSKWAEDALMAAGNYYWVGLDRGKAITYYDRILDNYPSGRHAFNAEWRIAWIAYLTRQPYADEKLINFLRKYPISANSPDILYWLGRNAERNGNLALARGYFRGAVERFPETYFGQHAAVRLDGLGAGDQEVPEVLASIPPAPPLRPFDEAIPPAATDRWQRAQALRVIALDAAAELELKAAYFASPSPRLLFEAAQAAFDQGHFSVGMGYARVIVPNFDARRISEVPINVWKALFPLPYEAPLRREAARNGFDPMLAAGLIRQESTFQADAVSRADAVGLMQVLPQTGRLLARQLRIRYTKNKLFEPEYNIQLGMLYVAGLLRTTGAPEYALAAFNAGEDRIAAWRAERTYEEIPELVESIPFTETREYVQIVLRNSEVYRMIYGSGNAPPTNTASSATGSYWP